MISIYLLPDLMRIVHKCKKSQKGAPTMWHPHGHDMNRLPMKSGLS